MPGVYFYPLDIRMRTIGQKATIMLFGRTSSGQSISVIDGSYLPYFYIVPKEDPMHLMKALTRFTIKARDDYYSIVHIEQMTMNVHEKEAVVLKTYINNPLGVLHIYDALMKRADIAAIYEHDVPFVQSYLFDRRIVPGVLTRVEGEFANMHSKVPVMTAQSVVQEEDEMLPTPKILAFDIETYTPEGKAPSPEHDPIIMISFYGNDFKKTITWKRFATENTSIEFVPGEFELLHAFKKVIDEFQPDFLVGYASDIFAFPYLKQRADKYNIAFDIGVDHSVASITRTETSIKGITHIDLYKFISKVLASKFESNTYRLDEIAREVLGEGKKAVDVSHLADVWDHNPAGLEPYCEYNLHDAYLMHSIAKILMPVLYEFVKLTGLQFFDAARGNFSHYAESFLMKESRLAHEMIPPRLSFSERSDRATHSSSGFSLEPQPGIYQKIAVFDFTSLYPSIVVTHNISAGTLRCKCCTEIVPGEEMHFCKNKTGFFPKILGYLIDRRKRILKMLSDGIEKSDEQKRLLAARQECLKVLANSLSSYFGYPSSRWYGLECAKAITAYGRHYLQNVMKEVGDAGFEILYADTDTLFIRLNKKSPEDAKQLFDQINASLPERMQLEYEGFYPKGIFVATKEGKGALKKYALLSEQGFLQIRGLEATRRNASTIAKETQEKVLQFILKEGKLAKAVAYVRNVINDIQERVVPLQKMIIYTQLQKDILAYETIAPHVAVAKKMQQHGFNVTAGSLIEYVVASGSGSIAERSFVPSEVREYDSEYYVNNQILPAIEKVFEAAGVDLQQALEEKEQSSLGEFI